MTDSKLEDQKAYVSTSTVELNVESIYANIIDTIEKLRCNTVLASDKYKNLKDYKDFDKKEGQYERSVQETRLNAFYRYLGLPIFSPNTKIFFNPGFDPGSSVFGDNENISDEHKYEVVKSLEKLFPIFDKRNSITQEYTKPFENGGVLSTLAAALSCDKINARPKFAFYQLDKGPFDKNETNQSYSIKNDIYTYFIDNICNYYGKTKEELFGDSIVASDKRYHIIKPFMSDPRYFKAVYPDTHMVAVPFLKDGPDNNVILRFSGNDAKADTFVTRPFIENVCGTRLKQNNSNYKLSDDEIRRIESVKKTAKENATGIYSFLNNSIDSYSVEFKMFLNNYEVMRQAVRLFQKSFESINLGISKSNVLLSVKGSMDNGTYEQLSLSYDQTNNYNNQLDNELAYLTYYNELTSIVDKYIVTDKSADVNILTKVMPGLAKQRKDAYNSVVEGLKKVELLLGNYSGLGYFDVIVITSALWLIDKETLVNLLDDAAISRIMKYYPPLQDELVQKRLHGAEVNAVKTLQSLENAIMQQYALLDSMIQAAMDNKEF